MGAVEILTMLSILMEEEEIDLASVNADLKVIEGKIEKATKMHNGFLKELGLLKSTRASQCKPRIYPSKRSNF